MSARLRANPLPAAPSGIPAVSASTMREMDRVLVDEMGLALLSMMENAGRGLADAVEQVAPEAAAVTVLAGKGGNGGGGLAAGRHLSNRGYQVDVHLASSLGDLGEAAATQAHVLQRSGIPLSTDGDPELANDVVVDALLGYGQTGPPRGRVGDLVAWAGRADATPISLDVPTGLDPDDGSTRDPRVTPVATVTLALPKRGLVAADPADTGDLLLADIGIPGPVYERFGAKPPVCKASLSTLDRTTVREAGGWSRSD